MAFLACGSETTCKQVYATATLLVWPMLSRQIFDPMWTCIDVCFLHAWNKGYGKIRQVTHDIILEWFEKGIRPSRGFFAGLASLVPIVICLVELSIKKISFEIPIIVIAFPNTESGNGSCKPWLEIQGNTGKQTVLWMHKVVYTAVPQLKCGEAPCILCSFFPRSN